MSVIKDIKHPWREKYQTARFRGAMFFVETEARQGGRRVAVHEFPKRNVDYAEDMGRAANRFAVQGYLIGPNYLDFKNNLIAALEKDGPGWLRLPMPYQGADVQVMVVSYSVTEARERGGFCQIDMAFVEYGNPEYRETISTETVIDETASKLEATLIKPLPAAQRRVRTDVQRTKRLVGAIYQSALKDQRAARRFSIIVRQQMRLLQLATQGYLS